MKKIFKRIIGSVTSAAVSVALIGGGLSDMGFMLRRSAPFVVCASEAATTEWQADIYYIVLDEIDINGVHNQWYTTDDIAFRPRGLHIKLNGKDVTEECNFSIGKGVTPGEVYNGKDFDYEVPMTIECMGDYVETTLVTKIGKKGDTNLDHCVDVRDAAAMARDVKRFQDTKKSSLDEFGIYLSVPHKETSAYSLDNNTAAVLANKLAKDALKRADHEKLEQTGSGDYSISLSKANGLPGETVSVQLVIDADDTFESLDALIEWDDKTLASAAAVAVNGTLCQSYAEDGMVSVVDYGSGAIGDGAVANIEFTIPADATPGEQYEIYFSSIETFSVIKDGNTTDVRDDASIVGTKITVNKPSSTTPPVTTNITTSAVTTQTSVSATQSTTVSDSTTAPVSTANVTTSAVTTSAVTSVSTSASTASTEVSDTTTTAATSVTQATIPVIIVPVVRGDSNLDGKLDVRDAAYIAKLLSEGKGEKLPRMADYNQDGVINVRDAAAIAKYLSISK